MVKLGLIGGGYWGKNLIREFNNCGVLSVICDVNTQALAEYNKLYPHITTTTDWNNVLEDETIDSVCVALPAEMHHKFAKSALECGKNVYVEKPITLDVAEAQELINLAKEKGVILMVGHLLHYHPAVAKIKEIVASGKIGKIRNIVANRLNLGIFRVCENVLWSFAPHDISVVLALCEDKLPVSVSCNGKDFITKGIHDITTSVLKYDDKYVNINVNWLNPYKEQRLSIIGEKGMLLFDDMKKEGKLELYSDYVQFQKMFPVPVKTAGEIIELDMSESPLLTECKHFVHCCETGDAPITSGEEGLRVLQVLNALQKSLENEGKEVKMGIVDAVGGKKMGYFAHETAIIDDGADIGEGTKVWHYSHICRGAKIGRNCNIGQNVFIAGGAVIGDNCKVQNNVSIYAGVKAGNYVFFGPSCVLTNDINPRGMYSKAGEYLETVLEDGVTLGANCTIVCGHSIGKHALIGAGAVVCHNVEEYSIMVGNPAKRIGTIDEKGERTKL